MTFHENFGAVASNFVQPVSNMSNSIDRLLRINIINDYTQSHSEESETLFRRTLATDHFRTELGPRPFRLSQLGPKLTRWSQPGLKPTVDRSKQALKITADGRLMFC